jgi:hypothetical protein
MNKLITDISRNLKMYRTIILHVVSYGCETWSLTLREEHRLRVFENRVLRGICGPKKDKVTGEWRRLHNEELHDLYSSQNIIWVIKSRMKWAGYVAHMGDKAGTYRVLVGTPEVMEDLRFDRKITLKWIFKKWDGRHGPH